LIPLTHHASSVVLNERGRLAACSRQSLNMACSVRWMTNDISIVTGSTNMESMDNWRIKVQNISRYDVSVHDQFLRQNVVSHFAYLCVRSIWNKKLPFSDNKSSCNYRQKRLWVLKTLILLPNSQKWDIFSFNPKLL